VWGENWIAVGDSAMAFDPLSAQGVYRAMISGLGAAHAIAGFFSNETEVLAAYAADLSTEFDRYMLQRLHYYSMETRWATKDFWRRRHARGVAKSQQTQEMRSPSALIHSDDSQIGRSSSSSHYERKTAGASHP
jgi:flavin-dependent dehydrogenase